MMLRERVPTKATGDGEFNFGSFQKRFDSGLARQRVRGFDIASPLQHKITYRVVCLGRFGPPISHRRPCLATPSLTREQFNYKGNL